MNYTDLHGSTVSRIMLGTWAIGGANWGSYDESEASRAIDYAIDHGISAIDTAPAYGSGRAEKLVGKSIKGRRDKVFIATKCGLDIEQNMRTDLSPAFIEKDLHGSLSRLGVDCIDLYQCHWPDPATPIAETMAALNRFREQGKIRMIGVSNFSREQILEAARHADIATLQPQYSLLERGIEAETVPACVEKHIALIPYAPLGGGMLTGKYTEPPKFSKSDARSFFYPFFQARHWPKVNGLVDTLRRIAAGKGAKPSHIAIAWVLSRAAVAAALVGARNPAQVEENLHASDIALTADEIALLDRQSAAVYG